MKLLFLLCLALCHCFDFDFIETKAQLNEIIRKKDQVSIVFLSHTELIVDGVDINTKWLEDLLPTAFEEAVKANSTIEHTVKFYSFLSDQYEEYLFYSHSLRTIPQLNAYINGRLLRVYDKDGEIPLLARFIRKCARVNQSIVVAKNARKIEEVSKPFGAIVGAFADIMGTNYEVFMNFADDFFFDYDEEFVLYENADIYEMQDFLSHFQITCPKANLTDYVPPYSTVFVVMSEKHQPIAPHIFHEYVPKYMRIRTSADDLPEDIKQKLQKRNATGSVMRDVLSRTLNPRYIIEKRDYLGEFWNSNFLAEFLVFTSFPVFGVVQEPVVFNLKIMSSTKLPLILCVFSKKNLGEDVDYKDIVPLHSFEKIALKFKFQIVAAYFVFEDSPKECARLGVYSPNTAVILGVDDKKALFIYNKTDPFTPKQMNNFITDYFDSKLSPSLRSQPVPTEKIHHLINIIVASNLNQTIAMPDKSVFIYFYARTPDDEALDELTNTYDSLTEEGKEQKYFFGIFDFEINDLPQQYEFEHSSLVCFIDDGDDYVVYRGPFIPKFLLPFIQNPSEETAFVPKETVEKYIEEQERIKFEESEPKGDFEYVFS